MQSSDFVVFSLFSEATAREVLLHTLWTIQAGWILELLVRCSFVLA